MLSTTRYDFIPFDSSFRLDQSSNNYCGMLSEISTGLVTVVNSITIKFIQTFSASSTSSILSWSGLPSPLPNDVRILSASLQSRFLTSTLSSDTTLSLNSMSKFMDIELSISLFPTYWSELAILSVQSLAYLHYRVLQTSLSLSHGYIPTQVLSNIYNISSDIVCSTGYESFSSELAIPSFYGVRQLSYLGLSIRLLLKNWLRWSDTSLLTSSWYSIILSNSIISSILGVSMRLTDSVTWLSRIESTHNKVCYGSIMTVGDEVVRYTGLSYEVQAVSIGLLMYVSAIWRSSSTGTWLY